MKYCKNCGSSVDDSDVFCGNCGTRVFSEEENSIAQPFAKQNERVDNTFENKEEVTRASSSSEKKRPKVLKENSDAMLCMILGIVALCGGGIIFAIISIVLSKRAQELCKTGEYDGESNIKTGLLCSKIAIILTIVGVVISVIVMIAVYLPMIFMAM